MSTTTTTTNTRDEIANLPRDLEPRFIEALHLYLMEFVTIASGETYFNKAVISQMQDAVRMNMIFIYCDVCRRLGLPASYLIEFVRYQAEKNPATRPSIPPDPAVRKTFKEHIQALVEFRSFWTSFLAEIDRSDCDKPIEEHAEIERQAAQAEEEYSQVLALWDRPELQPEEIVELGKNYIQRVAELEKERGDLQRATREATEAYKSIETKVGALQAEIESLGAHIAKERKSIEEYQNAKMGPNIDDLKREATALSTDMKAIKEPAAAAARKRVMEIDILLQLAGTTESKLRSLSGSLDRAVESVKEFQKDQDRARKDRDAMDSKRREFQRQVDSLDNDKDKLHRGIRGLDEQLAELEAERDELERRTIRLETEHKHKVEAEIAAYAKESSRLVQEEANEYRRLMTDVNALKELRAGFEAEIRRLDMAESEIDRKEEEFGPDGGKIILSFVHDICKRVDQITSKGSGAVAI